MKTPVFPELSRSEAEPHLIKPRVLVCPGSTAATQLEHESTFYRVVECLTDGSPDQHFRAGDRFAVFSGPIIPFARSNADHGDAWIVDTFRKPCFHQRLPELLNLFLVSRDARIAVQRQKIRMCRALEVKRDVRITLQFLIFMTVIRAKEPKLTSSSTSWTLIGRAPLEPALEPVVQKKQVCALSMSSFAWLIASAPRNSARFCSGWF